MWMSEWVWGMLLLVSVIECEGVSEFYCEWVWLSVSECYGVSESVSESVMVS